MSTGSDRWPSFFVPGIVVPCWLAGGWPSAQVTSASNTTKTNPHTSVGSSLLEAVFYNNTLGFHLFLSFVLVIMSTASKVVVLEESPVKVHSPSKLYNTVLDWVPLVGILVLHLVLGICVDNWKEGKSLLIEEILAR